MNGTVADYHKCRFIGRGRHFSFYRKLQLRCHLCIRFVVRSAASHFLRVCANYKKNSKYTFLQAITIVFSANSSSILLYFTSFCYPFIYPAAIHSKRSWFSTSIFPLFPFSFFFHSTLSLYFTYNLYYIHGSYSPCRRDNPFRHTMSYNNFLAICYIAWLLRPWRSLTNFPPHRVSQAKHFSTTKSVTISAVLIMAPGGLSCQASFSFLAGLERIGVRKPPESHLLSDIDKPNACKRDTKPINPHHFYNSSFFLVERSLFFK